MENNNNPNNNTADKKKTKKKCACLGRDTKVDPDLYFKVKEENEKLKKDKLAQDERIRKLEVSLANIKENIIRERKQADYKVINNNNDLLNDNNNINDYDKKFSFQCDKEENK